MILLLAVLTPMIMRMDIKMKRFKRWIAEIFGLFIVIDQIESLQVRVTKLEKHARIGKRSMRYDEVERARKRRYKKAA